MARWPEDDDLWAKPTDHRPTDRSPDDHRSPDGSVYQGPRHLGPDPTPASASDRAVGDAGNPFALYQQAPATELRPLGVWARIVVVLLALGILSAFYSIYAYLQIQRVPGRISDGLWVSDAEAQAVDDRLLDSFWIWLGVTVAAGIAFVIWFWRLRSNAEVMAPQLQRRSQGWAFWGWIVPIVSLWFPLQIAKDAVYSAPERPRSRQTLTLIAWWWGFWIAGSLAGGMGSWDESYTVSQLSTAMTISIIGEVVWIVAAVLAILVVRALTEIQQPRSAATSPIAERLPDNGGPVG